MDLPKAWNAKSGAGSFFAIKKPIQEVCNGNRDVKFLIGIIGHCTDERNLL